MTLYGAYLAAVGAGLAVGISGMGSGMGVGISGAAGAYAIADKPEKFTTAIIFQAIPQTQAIYGLLIALLILMGSGIIGGAENLDNIPVSFGLASIGCGLAVGIAGLSAIGQGITCSSAIGTVTEKPGMLGKSLVFSVIPETQAIYGLLVAILLLSFTGILARDTTLLGMGNTGIAIGYASIACGLSVGIAGLSAIGQGIACASSIGVTSEKPEMFGKGMLLSVLPETQAIYGLLIAVLIIAFANMFSKNFDITIGQGLAVIGCGLAVGIAGLSAIGQGITASAAVSGVSKNPSEFGRSVILVAMSETFAIFGVLIAILIMRGVGLM